MGRISSFVGKPVNFIKESTKNAYGNLTDHNSASQIISSVFMGINPFSGIIGESLAPALRSSYTKGLDNEFEKMKVNQSISKSLGKASYNNNQLRSSMNKQINTLSDMRRLQEKAVNIQELSLRQNQQMNQNQYWIAQNTAESTSYLKSTVNEIKKGNLLSLQNIMSMRKYIPLVIGAVGATSFIYKRLNDYGKYEKKNVPLKDVEGIFNKIKTFGHNTKEGFKSTYAGGKRLATEKFDWRDMFPKSIRLQFEKKLSNIILGKMSSSLNIPKWILNPSIITEAIEQKLNFYKNESLGSFWGWRNLRNGVTQSNLMKKDLLRNVSTTESKDINRIWKEFDEKMKKKYGPSDFIDSTKFEDKSQFMDYLQHTNRMKDAELFAAGYTFRNKDKYLNKRYSQLESLYEKANTSKSDRDKLMNEVLFHNGQFDSDLIKSRYYTTTKDIKDKNGKINTETNYSIPKNYEELKQYVMKYEIMQKINKLKKENVKVTNEQVNKIKEEVELSNKNLTIEEEINKLTSSKLTTAKKHGYDILKFLSSPKVGGNILTMQSSGMLGNGLISSFIEPYLLPYAFKTGNFASVANMLAMKMFPFLKKPIGITSAFSLRKRLLNPKDQFGNALPNIFDKATNFYDEAIHTAVENKKNSGDLTSGQIKEIEDNYENYKKNKGKRNEYFKKAIHDVSRNALTQKMIDGLARTNMQAALAIQITTGNYLGALRTAVSQNKVLGPVIKLYDNLKVAKHMGNVAGSMILGDKGFGVAKNIGAAGIGGLIGMHLGGPLGALIGAGSGLILHNTKPILKGIGGMINKNTIPGTIGAGAGAGLGYLLGGPLGALLGGGGGMLLGSGIGALAKVGKNLHEKFKGKKFGDMFKNFIGFFQDKKNDTAFNIWNFVSKISKLVTTVPRNALKGIGEFVKKVKAIGLRGAVKDTFQGGVLSKVKQLGFAGLKGITKKVLTKMFSVPYPYPGFDLDQNLSLGSILGLGDVTSALVKQGIKLSKETVSNLKEEFGFSNSAEGKSINDAYDETIGAVKVVLVNRDSEENKHGNVNPDDINPDKKQKNNKRNKKQNKRDDINIDEKENPNDIKPGNGKSDEKEKPNDIKPKEKGIIGKIIDWAKEMNNNSMQKYIDSLKIVKMQKRINSFNMYPNHSNNIKPEENNNIIKFGNIKPDKKEKGIATAKQVLESVIKRITGKSSKLKTSDKFTKEENLMYLNTQSLMQAMGNNGDSGKEKKSLFSKFTNMIKFLTGLASKATGIVSKTFSIIGSILGAGGWIWLMLSKLKQKLFPKTTPTPNPTEVKPGEVKPGEVPEEANGFDFDSLGSGMDASTLAEASPFLLSGAGAGLTGAGLTGAATYLGPITAIVSSLGSIIGDFNPAFKKKFNKSPIAGWISYQEQKAGKGLGDSLYDWLHPKSNVESYKLFKDKLKLSQRNLSTKNKNITDNFNNLINHNNIDTNPQHMISNILPNLNTNSNITPSNKLSKKEIEKRVVGFHYSDKGYNQMKIAVSEGVLQALYIYNKKGIPKNIQNNNITNNPQAINNPTGFLNGLASYL